jgi:prepilin signal peptidase PulO-like enzyme (type II secretory pathway)
MFVLGLVNGYEMSVIAIFMAAIIGLPISIFMFYKNESSTIPFGPFLAVASLIIFLFEINITDIMTFLY